VGQVFFLFFTRARRYTSAVFQTRDLLGLQEGISARHCIKTDRRIEIVFGIDSTPSVYRNHTMCWKKELGYLSSETLPRFRAAPYMFTQRQPSTQSLGPRPTLEIDVSFSLLASVGHGCLRMRNCVIALLVEWPWCSVVVTTSCNKTETKTSKWDIQQVCIAVNRTGVEFSSTL